MAGISVLSQKLDLQPGLSIALFPMVIISMTIERMSIVWEERGASEAIQEGVGSLLVAGVGLSCHGRQIWLEHLVFVFPELLLIVDRGHAARRPLHGLSLARAATLSSVRQTGRGGLTVTPCGPSPTH